MTTTQRLISAAKSVCESHGMFPFLPGKYGRLWDAIKEAENQPPMTPDLEKIMTLLITTAVYLRESDTEPGKFYACLDRTRAAEILRPLVEDRVTVPLLWTALKQQCCVNPETAVRCVNVTERDLALAVGSLLVRADTREGGGEGKS